MRIVLVIHNVRSAHNVGSLLRTAEGLAIGKVYMTGYTPYPEARNDSRLPHERQKTSLQIHKTALGAEDFLDWQHEADINKCINELADAGFLLVALEQSATAISLDKFETGADIALVVGNEISGIDGSVLETVDQVIQIPMSGRKESFNVAVAAGIALYYLRYGSRQK